MNKMSKSTIKAQEIIESIKNGESIETIKLKFNCNPNDWYSYSSKAYGIFLENARRERKKDEAKEHVLTTSNNEISAILKLNEKLADHALLLPIFSTKGEFNAVNSLESNLPNSETEILEIIGKMTMHPRLRVLQKKGRIEKFEYFKIFSKMVDAATLCYYRTNFISCYLTLLPIIEGVIIRWMGYTETDAKPEFEEIRKFFKNSALRQPCPTNILFHNIYTKACDKILNEHFYKPTTTPGNSYANFNRHVASHLLNDDQFATKENCIRLFILLDAMTEIYFHESRENDPRFNLSNEEIAEDIKLLTDTLLENLRETPEQKYFGTNLIDILQ